MGLFIIRWAEIGVAKFIAQLSYASIVVGRKKRSHKVDHRSTKLPLSLKVVIMFMTTSSFLTDISSGIFFCMLPPHAENHTKNYLYLIWSSIEGKTCTVKTS